MHGVLDPNATPFNPDEHSLCAICQVKLWELGRAEVGFEMRGSVVQVTTTPPDVPFRKPKSKLKAAGPKRMKP
jgi:hypothetical protein